MSQNVGVDAAKIIDLAAKSAMIIGQGQVLSASDIQDAFDILNIMLGEWSEQRSSVYHLTDTTITANGSQSYTVGVGGTIDPGFYPLRLEGAFFGNNNVNYPLRVIHAREDWNLIALKTLASFPKYAFLDTAYPLANLYVWPIPDSAYTITITLMAPLTQFSYLTDAVTLRPAYQSALVNNLAVRLAPLHGMEAPPTIQRQAVTSKRTIEKANTQIPVLQVPRDLNRKGHYNVFSDRLT